MLSYDINMDVRMLKSREHANVKSREHAKVILAHSAQLDAGVPSCREKLKPSKSHRLLHNNNEILTIEYFSMIRVVKYKLS